MAKKNFTAVSGEGVVKTQEAVKAITKESGIIAYSPYAVFPMGTKVLIAPIGSDYFGFSDKLTFKVGSREYTEQRGLFVFLDGATVATPVHFTGSFRARPAISNSGDDDFLQQLLEQKKVFVKKGFTAEGVRIYAEDPVPCVYFDDPTDINHMRMSRVTSDWDVIQMLAGHEWEVVDMVIAETRRFQKGLPPRQMYMNIPILKKIGDWEE